MNRAYSLFEIKSVDSDQRIISGLATTPSPDRVGDIIEPAGVRYKNPLPLLLYHDATKPVGKVTFSKPTDKGVAFTAKLPHIEEPGVLRDRVEEAWLSIKHGLIGGVSVGFRVVDDGQEPIRSGGWRFTDTEVLELSLVTIPANSQATIETIKSIDAPFLAATGDEPDADPLPAGVPARRVRMTQQKKPMTIAEQITALEARRAAKMARVNELMKKAADEGATLDDEETLEYDELVADVKKTDEHLTRAAQAERLNREKAVAVAAPAPTPYAPVAPTAPTQRITVKPNVGKGIGFARYAMAIGAGKGDYQRTVEYAKQWNDSTPEVELMVKAAVAAGTTSDATWAGPLAVARPLVDEFLELLRPKTLIGRIPGLTKVPFNISVPAQTSGGTYGWVGQGLMKPVTKMDFTTVTLGINKAAGIVALTEELVRSSSPSAEATVRDSMIKGIVAFLDIQFVDPAITEVVGVRPASITNGATATATAGVTAANSRTDFVRELTAFTAAEYSLSELVILMSESNAFAMGIGLNALGQPLFPTINGSGGSWQGATIITSNAVGNRIVFLHAPSILFADDGGVNVDVSREASVIMNDAPDGVVQAAGAAPTHVSLWQANMVGLKAERWITWKRARTTAVRVVTGVAYTGA
jgi:HK97 family phage major capsid protein/HK97 family phage prohead protease